MTKADFVEPVMNEHMIFFLNITLTKWKQLCSPAQVVPLFLSSTLSFQFCHFLIYFALFPYSV